MTRVLTFFFLTFELLTSAQTVRVDTLKFSPSTHLTKLQSAKLKYPLIRTGNRSADSLINFDIKNRLTSSENPHEAIDTSVIKWADEVIIFLDFNVTYNQGGIISLNISAEGCGAHCSNWTDYFNYITTTGKPLSISSVVDTAGAFRDLVFSQASEQYDKELVVLKANKSSDIDSLSYNWAIENYTECRKSIDFERFALYPNQLEIIETCDLPNAIKNLNPSIKLIYNFKDISKYLVLKKTSPNRSYK
jgi:hypothetical protein